MEESFESFYVYVVYVDVIEEMLIVIEECVLNLKCTLINVIEESFYVFVGFYRGSFFSVRLLML